MEKTFIKVIAEHFTDGMVKPISIDWAGRKLSVDKISDIRLHP